MSAAYPNEAERELVHQALRWANWCVGEGICAASGQIGDDGEPIIDPETFLMTYTDATGDEEWETLPARLTEGPTQ